MNDIQYIITVVCVCLGAAGGLLAGAGIVRMPDVFTRSQASSKASTLGAILVLIPCTWIFPEQAVWTVVIIFFLAMTAPVGAHVICRAAYRTGVRMKKTQAPGRPDEDGADERDRPI